MSENTREETANVALSMILEEYGMPSVSLVQLGRDIPDVYLVERGVRNILKMKREDKRKELIEQMGDRLDDDACEVVFGIIFPRDVVQGGSMAPSALDVKENLRDAKMEVLIQTISSDPEISRIDSVEAAQLPQLITTYSGEALDDEDLNEAVDRVSSAISDFVSNMGRHPNATSIAENIEEILENGNRGRSS